MEIYFSNSEVEGDCATAEGRVARWGEAADLVGRRLAELSALDSLDDAAYLPGVDIEMASDGRFQVLDELGVRLILHELRAGSSDPTRPNRLVLEHVAVRDPAITAAGDKA